MTSARVGSNPIVVGHYSTLLSVACGLQQTVSAVIYALIQAHRNNVFKLYLREKKRKISAEH
jgi:hypothetical protein